MMIRQRRSFSVSWAPLIALPWLALLAMSLSSMGQRALVGLAAVLLTALAWWIDHVRNDRVVAIDKASNRITVRRRRLWGSWWADAYALSDFAAVISYVSPGRNPVNWVDLVTQSGGEALLVASFKPGVRAESLLSWPTYGEAEQARHLRQTLVDALALVDNGFHGSRLPGAQVGPGQPP